MSERKVRPIPEDTAAAGKALFKKRMFYQAVGDQLGDLCESCQPLPSGGASEPHLTIPLLYLVTVFQYLESLSDSQAEYAVLNRVDWKYALHLPLIGLGFSGQELQAYQRRLLADPAVLQCLDDLLERVRNMYESSPKGAGPVSTASMLEAVSTLNRCSQVVRAMRLALEELAICHPAWLRRTVLPHWFERYARSRGDTGPPATPENRASFALAVGEDGFFLMDALGTEDAPGDASQLPEIEYFRHVWSQQFERTDGRVTWRTPPGPRAGPEPDPAGA